MPSIETESNQEGMQAAPRTMNAQQRRAAMHEGGPLIILAGPGTGKTFVMAQRVAQLINERGASPESVLAVTFSLKAREELGERIGLYCSKGDAVRTQTFNGLGHEILTTYADRLGLPPTLIMIDGAQHRRLLRELIVKHRLFASSRAAGMDALLSTLLGAGGAFEGIANRGASAAELRAVSEAWRSSAAAASKGATTEQERDAALADAGAAARFADEVALFELSSRERWQRGWMTYSDQLTLPLELLRTDSEVRARLRTDIRHIIVDEFQDCNRAQLELLKQLAGPNDPDLCIVGDDDQAIYGFRGSDERIFTRFAAEWPKHTVVELTENYRSDVSIITVSNAIIAGAAPGTRFRPDKQIVPRSDAGAGEVRLVTLQHDFEDAQAIAAMILADRAEAERAGSPRRWSNYAVLAKSHSDLQRIGEALRIESVPYELRKGPAFDDDPGVLDVLAWIEWLVNPAAAWAVRRLLMRPPVGLSADQSLELEDQYVNARKHADDGLPGAKNPGHFGDFLRTKISTLPGIAMLLERADDLRNAAAALRADEAVQRIIDTTDPVHAELLPGPARARRVTAIITLLSLAREKQGRLQPPGDLAAFWRHFCELRACDELKSLPMLGDDSSQEVETVGSGSEGRVQLLTAHASKGLEFGTVFVTRVHPSHGFGKYNERDGWQTPNGLRDSLDTADARTATLAEERRLFYVSCTRAKERLVLLSKLNKGPSKTQGISFYDELFRTPRTPPLPFVSATLQATFTRAAAVGVKVGPESTSPAVPLDEVRAAFDRARRRARLEAAMALESIETESVNADALNASAKRLAAVAAQLAAIAQVERTGTAPAWLLERDAELPALAAALAKGQDRAKRSAAALLLAPMSPPLELSVSGIERFEDCPRCFALASQLKLVEQEHRFTTLGTVVHAVLERFYTRWRLADAEGTPTPGLDDLLNVGRSVFSESVTESGLTREDLDQMLNQLERTFTMLHSAHDHVVELERKIRLPFPHAGHTHWFTCKLDRVDQLPDGRMRIIDYKSGKPTKALRSPGKNDLQLSIYALALRHANDDPSLGGVAEYWLTQIGERGVLDFADMDQDKVRARITAAIDAMIAGEFPRGKDCRGPCAMLDD